MKTFACMVLLLNMACFSLGAIGQQRIPSEGGISSTQKSKFYNINIGPWSQGVPPSPPQNISLPGQGTPSYPEGTPIGIPSRPVIDMSCISAVSLENIKLLQVLVKKRLEELGKSEEIADFERNIPKKCSRAQVDFFANSLLAIPGE
jgi:hypothetical protein